MTSGIEKRGKRNSKCQIDHVGAVYRQWCNVRWTCGFSDLGLARSGLGFLDYLADKMSAFRKWSQTQTGEIRELQSICTPHGDTSAPVSCARACPVDLYGHGEDSPFYFS